jgi:hypothetical protein
MFETKDAAKKNRIDNFERTCAEMQKEGYAASLGIISLTKANILALATAGPIAALCLALYLLRWNTIIFDFGWLSYGAFLAVFVICIAAHELLHGITWHFFCENKWKSIHFGILRSSLTPYCNCKEPLGMKYYLAGTLMPFFMLGVVMFIVSYMIGNAFLMLISLTNMLGAGGDTTIALMLMKYKSAVILDHPTECGFMAFTK